MYVLVLLSYMQGGMKAVLWTDTLQSLLMVVGVIAVMAAGVHREGGVANVWEASRVSGRLDFLV